MKITINEGCFGGVLEIDDESCEQCGNVGSITILEL